MKSIMKIKYNYNYYYRAGAWAHIKDTPLNYLKIKLNQWFSREKFESFKKKSWRFLSKY